MKINRLFFCVVVAIAVSTACNRSAPPPATKANPQVEQMVRSLSKDGSRDIVIIQSVPNRFLGRMEVVAVEGEGGVAVDQQNPAFLGTVLPNALESRTGRQEPITGIIQATNKSGVEQTILLTPNEVYIFWDAGLEASALGARTGLQIIDKSGSTKCVLR